MNYKFDVKKVKDDLIKWIRDWFIDNGYDCNAVIGISGGCDSSVVAALCVESLGKDRVVGVLMPNGEQSDIDDSYRLVKHLDINYLVCDIGPAVIAVKNSIEGRTSITTTIQTNINLPPRIRMATLYAVSQSMNGRVINTCNLSEDYVGYATIFGDAAGDMSPLGNLTKTEVKLLGHELGLPADLVEKTPSDGLCGKSDEENIGFSYAILDQYIRVGTDGIDPEIAEKIRVMHEKNKFKMEPMPGFKANIRSLFSGNF